MADYWSESNDVTGSTQEPYMAKQNAEYLKNNIVKVARKA